MAQLPDHTFPLLSVFIRVHPPPIDPRAFRATVTCANRSGALSVRNLFAGSLCCVASLCASAAAGGAAWSEQIEQDWLRQAQAAAASGPGQGRPATTREDAAGACDGIKDGKYGFHTGQEANPWWQVDLGSVQPLSKVAVYNRLDYAPGLHNADKLVLLTSPDGKTWTQVYDNEGKHFGGVSGAKPLEVTFAADKVQARYVRLKIPSEAPIYFHLDEVEVYGLADAKDNLALHKPADQSSTSQWSTIKALPVETAPSYPVAEWIGRGRRVASDLRESGVNVSAFLQELDDAEKRLAALQQAGGTPAVRTAGVSPAPVPPAGGAPAAPASGAAGEATRRLYLEVRWICRRLAFANPLLGFRSLLFVKRFTQESYPDVCLNHMAWVSRPGGDICVLTNPFSPDGSGQTVRPVIAGQLGPGHVHGMDLWWDAGRIVFGYAKAKSGQPPAGWLDRSRSYELRRAEEPLHLFEIGVDGKGLRQLTSGEWGDLDPTYLPNGDIAFVSERCAYSLQCNEYDKDETSCNLYVMKPDGSGIRRLSVSKDGDYLPHALDDGTIGYTRWEYQERSWAFIQSIWTIRPDGTGADSLYKQHMQNPWALYDVRSIPQASGAGIRKLVAVAGGHHTLYCGPVCIIDPTIGMNNPRGLAIVTPNVKPQEGGMAGFPVPEGGVQDGGGIYMNPWPLSEKHFLAAYSYLTLPNDKSDAAGYALYLIDVFGTKELLYRDPAISSSLPIPLGPRIRPPILAEAFDPTKDGATCALSSAGYGVEGIEPGRIRFLRVSEAVGWPYDNKSGGQRYGEDHGGVPPLVNWTPVRILGDVPIEADGSAHFTVPADKMVYFQLLDEKHMELRRMRSFISFQPGEQRGCVGCHETRSVAPPAPSFATAQRRPPSQPQPPPWGDRPVSFLRDVQPVFDQHCVSCHSGLKPAGQLDFSGGLTSHLKSVAGYGYNRAFETIEQKGLVSRSAARAQDASITPPLAYGSPKSKLLLALRTGPCAKRVTLSGDEWLRLEEWIDANAPYHDDFVNKRPATPAYDLAADSALLSKISGVHERRCAACHKPAEVSRLDWIDLRRPERSLFLTAPLANPLTPPSPQGGEGSVRACKEAVYKDQNDADYQALRQAVEAAVKRAWDLPRRDLRALARP